MELQNRNSCVIDLPESFVSAGIDRNYVREAVAAIAYYNGIVSEYEACTMIDASRRTFEEKILPKFGLSVIGGTKEDREFEVQGL